MRYYSGEERRARTLRIEKDQGLEEGEIGDDVADGKKTK